MKNTPGKDVSIFQVVCLVPREVPKNLMLHVSYIPVEKNIFFPTFRKNFKHLFREDKLLAVPEFVPKKKTSVCLRKK